MKNFVGSLLIRLGHDRTRDIALWQISVMVMLVLGVLLYSVYPYVTPVPPETEAGRTERELYEYASRLEAQFRGEVPVASYTWLASIRGFFLHHVGRVVAGLFGFSVVVTFIFGVRASGDVLSEQYHRVRARIWDTYGGGVHQQGFLTRLFAGASSPAGTRGVSPQEASASSSGASAPLTRRAFALSEITIELLLPMIARLFRGARRQ